MNSKPEPVRTYSMTYWWVGWYRTDICSPRNPQLRQNGDWSVHDDVIKWKRFPRYWPFVRGMHRSPVNFPHKGQWRGALMFPLICAWINHWVNNREAGDLNRHRAHYDVIVMIISTWLRPYYFRNFAHMYDISHKICTQLVFCVLFCGDCSNRNLKNWCNVFYPYFPGLLHWHCSMRLSSAWGLWMNWALLINPTRAGSKHSGSTK